MTGLIQRLRVRITGRLALRYPRPVDREDARLDQEAIDRITRLESVVRQCMTRFKEYEASHAAKMVNSSGEFWMTARNKANRNAQMANMCELALLEPEDEDEQEG